MIFQRFYDEGLAQASYLIGCERHGAAIVVDPRRDVSGYLEEATRRGLDIVAVTETHIHADYLSGARELAGATGAALHLSAEGGPEWTYRFDHQPVGHGDEIVAGAVALRAVHTPGHTPEHLTFLVTDRAAAGEPGIALTGDFVFAGDLGRPDLLDETGATEGSRFHAAVEQFSSLQERLLTLPDYVQVWPGHGAGSACGRSLGAVPSSTVGYERRFAWWGQLIEWGDHRSFAGRLLEGQPDAPTYFARMKRLNRDGPPLLGRREAPRPLDPGEVRRLLDGGARLLDSRPRTQYLAGAAPGAIHLPWGKNFSTWAGWLLEPDAEYILLASAAPAASEMRDHLSRVGVDRVAGFAPTLDGLALAPPAALGAESLSGLEGALLVDVRAASEYAEGHIPGAVQLHAGRIVTRRAALPPDRPVVLYCQSGDRSVAAGSALRAAGMRNVWELVGGYQAWLAVTRPARGLNSDGPPGQNPRHPR